MTKNRVSPTHRLPDRAPLDYAPDNEQGVVYLFSHLARSRFGLRVERVQAGFPDCIAYRDGKRIRSSSSIGRAISCSTDIGRRAVIGLSAGFMIGRARPTACGWLNCALSLGWASMCGSSLWPVTAGAQCGEVITFPS